MARYLVIDREVIPFYLTVRGEVPKILRAAHLLSSYYGTGDEAVRQVKRLAGVLNAIEEHMQHYDECCDGTLYDETRTILRLCDAISVGYAGPVSPDTSQAEYVRRLDSYVRTIREAVSEVRDLANLRVCEYCRLIRSECDCERCDYCDERIEDCECETCPYCDRNVNDCYCEHCEYCGANIHECSCARCAQCGLLVRQSPYVQHCTCDVTVVPIVQSDMPF